MLQFSKNKKYQYIFFSILSLIIVFNGGNSDLLIQLNFILIGLFFLYCLNDKNYFLHFQNFYLKNKISIIFFLIFLFYCIFQTIPLPENILKYLSPEKYKFVNLIQNNNYLSISFSPTNSYFQILNFLNLLVIVCITKMICYNDRHKYRFYFYLSLMGFVAALVAVLLYLNGNPDLLIFENSFYKGSSTGFFKNRTIFSVFLLFSLISSLELIKNLQKNDSKKDYFFLKIYIRIFLIFITVGIITSFSRIGNFLLIITIIFYLINEMRLKENQNKSFLITICLIIFFDLIILGFYFGASEVISRFYFLNEEYANLNNLDNNISRFELIKFSLHQLKNFLIFGYGPGSFEIFFQLKYPNLSNKFADHAHSDLIEFIGEFGLFGFLLLVLSFIKFFFIKKNYNIVNFILFIYIIIFLLFDFSLHIPIIQILFIIFFSIPRNITQSN